MLFVELGLTCSIWWDHEGGFSCALYMIRRSAFCWALHETSFSLQYLNCKAHSLWSRSHLELTSSLSHQLSCVAKGEWAKEFELIAICKCVLHTQISEVVKVELSTRSSGLCHAKPWSWPQEKGAGCQARSWLCPGGASPSIWAGAKAPTSVFPRPGSLWT